MTSLPLPGAELVDAGLRDLALGVESAEALLVSLVAPRLAAIGVEVPRPLADPDLRLYHRLAATCGDAAHARYNALVRRMVSFQRAAASAPPADRRRIDAFLDALAREASRDTDIFVVGGASAVLAGWRDTTIDVDLVLRPESDAMLRAIPALKERLHLNLALAAPDQFIPVPAGWEGRSPVIRRVGRVTIRHYDLCAQALAKLERGHARDLQDVRAMLDRGLVTGPDLRRMFAAIEPQLYRYPAIDPPSFRRAVSEVAPS